jgi:hypothetical protein
MKRLVASPLPAAAVLLPLFFTACGGGGSSDGSGGGVVPEPFCETDAECAAGSTNECAVATCDIGEGVCVSTPIPDGTPCNANEGVCRDSFCAQTELKAFVKSPNPEPDAHFGTSVSILGDRMIVGAPGSGTDSGTVAVFQRSAGEWAVDDEIESQDLPPSCPKGLFGWSVGSATDFVVVGSTGTSAAGSGSARLFRKPGDAWVEDTTFGCLVGSDTQGFDLFATSLAVTPSGETVVVGAPGRTIGGGPAAFGLRTYSGGAYVFERINSVQWEEAAILEASNAGSNYECSDRTGEGDAFGASVGLWGDVEGEINTVVVGAPGEASSTSGVALDTDGSNDDAPGAGAAYVFERDELTGDWAQTAYLKASNTNAGDRFGFAVAIHGDTIVVGAEREDSGDVNNQGDNSAIEAGAAYVFERSGDSWAQTHYLKASNVAAGYFFGANLTMTDTTLVVGSPGEGSIGGTNSGAAYVFSYVDGAWTQTNFYKAFNADADSAFAGPPGSVAYGSPSILNQMCPAQNTTKGASLSVSGDTLVVGTPYEDSEAVGVNGVPTNNPIPDSGAVYIFDNTEGE